MGKSETCQACVEARNGHICSSRVKGGWSEKVGDGRTHWEGVCVVCGVVCVEYMSGVCVGCVCVGGECM